MKNKVQTIILILILITAAFFRFFNLMRDEPYFFNPDERNMANAITQLRLPIKLSAIPKCIYRELFNPQFSSLDQPNMTECNLNPHFFAYGQFPLYLSYISNHLIKLPICFWSYFNSSLSTLLGKDNPLFCSSEISYPSSIFWLRFWSALASTLTVLFIYRILRIISNKKISLIIALISVFSPGLIQSAHFGTTESFLAFFFLVSLYCSLKLLLQPPTVSFKKNLVNNIKYAVYISLAIGLASGSKFTGLFLFVPPALSFLGILFIYKRNRKYCFKILFNYLILLLFIGLGSIAIAIVSSPYNLVDIRNFQSAVFGYESDVAIGRYQAFYTRQFINTVPILFQTEKIFPYTLGWPVFILGSLGFLLLNFNLFFKLSKSIIERIMNHELRLKNRSLHLNILDSCFFILNSSFLIYFVSNAFLYAKWTRFMTPIFPFFYIFAGIFLFQIHKLINSQKKITKFCIFNLKFSLFIIHYSLFIISILPGITFMSVYINEDSRLQASRWIYRNIPDSSYVLSETANVVDIPLGLPEVNEITKNYRVISFDFYHMDENPLIFQDLIRHLEKSDYIFIPSRRIMFNYTRLPDRFPLVTKYYQLLYSGALGFKKINTISSFPQLKFGLLNWEFNDEKSEETYTVFDHPVIRIFKKVMPLNKEDYLNLFRYTAS
ncbi:hypothetical protein A2Y99_02820 [Candidatus Gottesmanbacteria bacterium RBG_13_37_7]|uniref:ArnT-like N-terminal domain-containing protein n=1 Tax=Candidatus Gottesmanbacteria bacterium RBG_13_37_7 TaxID=1798369 RepID=A0A1F5YHH8_9BACT|nr:MAG: hypothetical protein A2Y99_02820 [Candidatus Gottesmanbacteria bacterium RBG_13_37_7]